MILDESDIERVILGELKSTQRKPKKFEMATSEQMRTLKEFNDHLKATGRTLRRRYLIITFLRNWVTVHVKKEFEDITEDDLKAYFTEMNVNNRPKSTIKQYEIDIRFFFRWLYKGRENRDKLEDLIDWMKSINHKSDSKHRMAQKTLKFVSIEMVEELLPHCINRRDEAIVITLFETGYRAEEFLSLNIGDYKEVGNGMIFQHEDLRESVMLIRSKPFIDAWIDVHPDRKDLNAPLWPTVKKNRMSYQNLMRIIKNLSNEAGFKGITPHTFRHGFGTYNAVRMKEHELKTAMGHSSTSEVTKYYIHLEMADVRKKQLESNGQEPKKETAAKSILRPQICKSCATHNAHGAVFCSGCGDPLTEVGENLREGKIGELTKAMEEMKWTITNLQMPDYAIQIAELKKENALLKRQMVSREEMMAMIKLKA